jgi:hypothetical protein
MAASAALRVYHDHPEIHTEYLETGMVGRRTQRIVLLPVSEGEVALPELSVRWWDVEADGGRTAILPGRTLRLQLAIAPAAAPAPAPLDVSPRTALRGFAALLLLGSAVALWLYLRDQALRDVRAKLRAACRRGDARGARDALIEWGRAAGAPAALDPVRASALDAALYAGRAWDGKAFWRAARPCLAKPKKRRAAPQAPLPPLFKLQARRI